MKEWGLGRWPLAMHCVGCDTEGVCRAGEVATVGRGDDRSLPAVVGGLLVDEPAWLYRSDGLSGSGLARLRVWETRPGDASRLCVLTDLGLGASMADSAEQIWAKLIALHGPGIVVLWHRPGEGEQLDQLAIGSAGPTWWPVWPSEQHAEWVAQHGNRILYRPLGDGISDPAC